MEWLQIALLAWLWHLQEKPDATMIVLGDLNHCSLEKSLPGFHQYVKCGTRKENILDRCYGNIKGAYTARARPPLGTSDHKTVHLLPAYRSVYKNTVHVWTRDATEELKGSFLCTDWDIFFTDADINTRLLPRTFPSV